MTCCSSMRLSLADFRVLPSLPQAFLGGDFARASTHHSRTLALSHSSGDRSEIWAEMFTFSHKAGLGLTGVSILCTVLWCAVEAASRRLCSD